MRRLTELYSKFWAAVDEFKKNPSVEMKLKLILLVELIEEQVEILKQRH